ncbi:unnamed protein product [Rotaria magnacalcarata]|uniref:Uncharacterized protein n=5 Tax=Rotaria magnacalcarata TaxID=392030 RepID=A0A816YYJ6_9BILA|nr:unnamed protein product [Rotaria magnacalcarata]CAF1628720.1 unnamed protein product [Rotaria magnacalcarata]CAF2159462.1 unnamed protein product [Rotaria magnacalcarata]CAF2174683.1 unnamed protein product [Rotaria magnacalcarata]CAF4078066.1 unnamed protein product [Rotaria magnacalcarata]
MLTTSINNSLCPTCSNALGLLEKIHFAHKIWHKACFRCKTCYTQLNVDTVKMRDDENHTLYCVRHYPDDDSVSMCSDNSILMSSFEQKPSSIQHSDLDYPPNWNIDDVTKWLGDISLQQYGDNFRKNDIDGSVLIDEVDGINDDTIKQLIPSLGTQLKFKKALRTLRSRAHTQSRPSSALSVAKQESEEHRQLLQTIKQQAEQITSLVSTVNTQAKQIEKFVAKLAAIPKPPPPVDAFSKSSLTVQNQLLDLPPNMSKIALASADTPASDIPAIDSVAPSVLPLPANSYTSSTTTSVPTAIQGPQGSTGVTFPAVVHPNIDGIAIKPVLDDIYNFQNYGKYAVTIFDQNSENILVQTLVNVVPENEICMPKKFVLRDSVNNILVGASVKLKLHDQVVFTGSTDSAGTVIMPTTLQKNCYDVEIHASDAQHKPSVFRMIVYENRGSEISTQFICRQLDSDQLEIVLKWGTIPRDLDSHLHISDGRHVYYESKVEENVSLDCDVTNGNGPETIKIRLEPGLKYLYVVHRYSRDGHLTKSGATVTFNNSAITNSNTPYQVVQIPVVNQPNANFWIVCEIDGTTKNIRMFENAFENHNNYASDEIGKKYLK